eukprot:TRINITY_DN3157_c0_g1_i2.p1 TRINITY_DN3157_c0_g1~~TRINITY_DN3157_c0_g1_i2.p1  ORF type:complete len:258 (+),score=90.68 TRINITY_DN3157_c0_g1_i2:48-821(+)
MAAPDCDGQQQQQQAVRRKKNPSANNNNNNNSNNSNNSNSTATKKPPVTTTRQKNRRKAAGRPTTATTTMSSRRRVSSLLWGPFIIAASLLWGSLITAHLECHRPGGVMSGGQAEEEEGLCVLSWHTLGQPLDKWYTPQQFPLSTLQGCIATTGSNKVAKSSSRRRRIELLLSDGNTLPLHDTPTKSVKEAQAEALDALIKAYKAGETGSADLVWHENDVKGEAGGLRTWGMWGGLSTGVLMTVGFTVNALYKWLKR